MISDGAGGFSSAQRRLIGITWLTYAAFYLGRLNISPALPAIARDLNIGLGSVGTLGTIFFICYAIGQVISGQLGNALSPRRMIFMGLLLVAISNIVFSMQTSLILLAILWGINGFAQASGWGPMLRILSSHLDTDQVRGISMFFSISFQIGTAVAWGLAGFLIASGSWQSAFVVPGIILIVIALIWYATGIEAKKTTSSQPPLRLGEMLADGRQLLPVLIAAACTGFIYIGLLLWLPTLIQTWDYVPDGLSRLLTAIVPLIGIPGMLSAGYFLSRFANVRRTILLFLSLLLISLLMSYLSVQVVQGLAVISAVMVASGLAGLLLSSAPMLLARNARVSSAGGLLTAVWSIAGGLSGVVVGSVAENIGWSAVFLLWIGVTFIAASSVWLASRNAVPAS